MGVSAEFESLEYQFLELISEFRSVTASEARLRDAVRGEATRAETAEAALAAAERGAAEARNNAAAASAGAAQAAAELVALSEQTTGLKMQLELAERHRTMLEEKCTEVSGQVNELERELHQLRPLQASHATLQRQYMELQERIVTATEEARREASRLESELRRVERCAAGGSEIRERARLAAAAHARERRLAAAELHHTVKELHAAHAEISRISSKAAELQHRLFHENSSKAQVVTDPDTESLAEVRSALEAERAGTEKLEKSLAAALADNATLAAQLHAKESTPTLSQLQSVAPSGPSTTTSICPIDSFLAD